MTDSGSLRLYDSQQQTKLLDASVHDTRLSIPTGLGGIDSLLRRGGLLPGTVVLLGGRTGPRKSTITYNMMVNMVQAGIPVALVGLDEQPWQYTVKLMSVMSGRSQDEIEEQWDEPLGAEIRRDYEQTARGKLHFLSGRRPDIDHIAAQAEMAGMGGETPQVIFIDYLALMTRDRKYGWSETDRVPRIAEELATWSTDSGISVVALHQLSRNDEYGGTNNRNAGHLPVTLAQLKYGGEEPADVVLGTYRPAMNPLAVMSMDVAKSTLGDRFDEDEYWEIRGTAKRYQDSTFLQLLKNRPGTHREERGVELVSFAGDALTMMERMADEPAYAEHRS